MNMTDQIKINHVLLLDDDTDFVTFLRHELTKAGLKVDEAQTADQALSLLNKTRYLCAIVDIVLGPNQTSEKVIQFFKK